MLFSELIDEVSESYSTWILVGASNSGLNKNFLTFSTGGGYFLNLRGLFSKSLMSFKGRIGLIGAITDDFPFKRFIFSSLKALKLI